MRFGIALLFYDLRLLCENSDVKISAAIITKNEEANIGKAIDSLTFVDEILVIDSGSTDSTVQIATERGARVVLQEWLGFGAQKQFAVETCENDWIFSLDADERVSEELADFIVKLKNADQSPSSAGYRFSRLTSYLGREIKHGGWYPDWQLRLFDRRRAHWKQLPVHESVEVFPGESVEKIKLDILHYSVSSIREHQQMIGERYAPLSAQKMYEQGKRTNVLKLAISPPIAFLQAYVLKGGFLDGWQGFVIAGFAAHHAFLKNALLLEKQKVAQTSF
ncbi:MAG: glycosyltransferase family 2 protein [Pyrinomonadaceae bacterium]